MQSRVRHALGSCLSIREVRLEDAYVLAAALRQADRDEIQAATAETPLEVLQRGIQTSDPCYAVARADDHLLAVFGVVPETSESGLIWLLGSDDLVRASISLLRWGPVWLDRLQRRYRILHNWVDARNARHIEWLLWCGFEIAGVAERFGVEGRPFLEVRRERASC